VSRVSNFANDETKTDNFKVASPGTTVNPGTLNVIKFYDTNTNGIKDPADVEITGWEVIVGAQSTFPTTAETKLTPVSIIVSPGCYTAQEGDATGWIHTTPKIDSEPVVSGGSYYDQLWQCLPWPRWWVDAGFLVQQEWAGIDYQY
jgi:hypothetical protein